MFRAILTMILLAVAALPAQAAETFTFESIDGGSIDTGDWAGRPLLVVNTASMCAYTRQYDGLQALYDRYRDAGLVVLAVPSRDFRQEYAEEEQVKDFCAVNFDLDLPMTTITPVSGPGAHPFYRWVSDTAGFVPSWNFNKVLIAPDGTVAATWGASTEPLSQSIVAPVERMLARSGG